MASRWRVHASGRESSHASVALSSHGACSLRRCLRDRYRLTLLPRDPRGYDKWERLMDRPKAAKSARTLCALVVPIIRRRRADRGLGLSFSGAPGAIFTPITAARAVSWSREKRVRPRIAKAGRRPRQCPAPDPAMVQEAIRIQGGSRPVRFWDGPTGRQSLTARVAGSILAKNCRHRQPRHPGR